MIGLFRRWREAVRDGRECRLGRRGTLMGRLAIGRWSWSAGVLNFGDDGGWSLNLGPLWVKLKATGREPKDDMLDRWGFTFDFPMRCLHLNWRHRTKILHFPWAMGWVRTERGTGVGLTFVTTEEAVRRWFPGRGKYRRVVNEERSWSDQPVRVPHEYRDTFTYVYTLKNGTQQDRTATVTTERMTWCWRLFWRVGIWFPKRTKTYIEVEFNDEVGERAGSWKGGTVGCGYELKPGETPLQCLRRMERERKFN